MPSTDTPTWWADVQQEREDLRGRGRRPADDWLGEDIDFVPRRRVADRGVADTGAIDAVDATGADHPLHGVFLPSASPSRGRRDAARTAPAGRTIEVELSSGAGAVARTIELHVDDAPAGAPVVAPATDMEQELRHLHAADDPFAVPPPRAGTRRTVQIKGRPGEGRAASQAQRHRPRTTSDRVGHRPDRVALWAVLLGAILIILAATSSSSKAATTPAGAPAAKVVHVAAPTAPALRAPAS